MPNKRLKHGSRLSALCLVVALFGLSSFRVLAAARNPVPIILISVDTLRPDHLGSYGYRRIPTPAIDSLCKGGTRFASASAQVPLTLPSHVSLFTSTYPFSNGVEDNGQALAPDALTLASILRGQGYATGAFIGGFALDSRFGLQQGFDVYDSPFNLARDSGVDLTSLKRPGEEVARSAEAWLDQQTGRPFFLFLHLYDLHTPYQPHPEVTADVGYDSELAYVDHVLNQFLSHLREKGLFDQALIVFLADHGESLGEHGESTHGYFIYQSTVHVPLIIHWPTVPTPLPPQVLAPSGLIDVAPTILQFLGVPIPRQFQGSSLLRPVPKNASPPVDTVYSESLYAHNHYSCSMLRSLRSGHYKYIEAPKPELYDLESDPNEQQNLYTQQRSLGHSLHSRLLSLAQSFPRSSASATDSLSPEAAEQLRALGYMPGSNTSRAGVNAGFDPKDRIVPYEQTHRAIAMAYAGMLQEAVDLLAQVLAGTPDLPDTRNILGLFQQKLGMHAKAAQNFREVLRANPDNALAHYNLAVSYFNLGQNENAIKEINVLRALAANAGRALDQVTIPTEELLGTILLQKKDYPHARAQFEHLLILSPGNFTAQFNLGWLCGVEGNLPEALQHLQVAVQLNPENADAHSALGGLLLRQGDLPSALTQFSETLRLTPNSAPAHYNLGLVLARQNASSEAAVEFRKALQADPEFTRAQDALNKLSQND